MMQEAGIPAKFAKTIGIAVDHRRRNRSLESLQVSLVMHLFCPKGGGGGASEIGISRFSRGLCSTGTLIQG